MLCRYNVQVSQPHVRYGVKHWLFQFCRESKVVGVNDTITVPIVSKVYSLYTCNELRIHGTFSGIPQLFKTIETLDWHAVDKELNTHSFCLFDVYRKTHSFCHVVVGVKTFCKPSGESLSNIMSSAY